MERNTFHIGLWNFAIKFFTAAKKLRGNERELSPVPVYFLYGHAIELSLKAFLAYHGFNEQKLRAIGHDLVRAWEKAREKGLDGNSHEVMEADETIVQINPYYKAKGLEYIVTGTVRYPKIVHMHNVAKNLISAIGKAMEIPKAPFNKWVKNG